MVVVLHVYTFIGVGIVGAVGAIALPLLAKSLRCFRAQIYSPFPVECSAVLCSSHPAPFLAHVPTGRFSTPSYTYDIAHVDCITQSQNHSQL